MSSDLSIVARDCGKAYRIYRKPQDWLKQVFARGGHKYYSEYWALRNINFEIRRGETMGILGRNGAGKSTLLQIIAGTLRPTTGSVEVKGRVAALLELGAGFNPEFTGRENVFLAASILGLSGEQITQRFESIAEFAGIGDFIDQPVKLYSSGMFARLAFAVVAHVDADVLIVDEILAVGDAAFTQKCMRFIRQFKERGTLLLVSHDTASITNLCDRAIWIDRGMIREAGPAKEVSYSYLASLFAEGDEAAGFRIGGAREDGARQGRRIEDPRRALLDASTHRNEIEVFDFDPNGPWFGKRGATIQGARLLDTEGRPLVQVTGGEDVVLEIVAQAHTQLDRPILGFYVKDRLGQNIFGDNTFLTYRDTAVRTLPHQRLVARFQFQLPFLPSGDFAVVVAIADGTQADHVQHHWMDDAFFFRVQSSHVVKGLVGIPMLDISLAVNGAAADDEQAS
ncbi:ABC transporter ATP-binding protein [Falsiroseomonas sp.]|uniref:ABC transporter ATP-binding protein n=1 Tax=Falsiroseomonas sp. TaxID=2870721 RepID=UPI0027217393|nr:ABC transporter ATP-binding protein [Falsiroseomonas sp.]MDO9500102.1 ABC transporter ATP-binding protein [Falsiroseomonas sp.]